MKKKKHIPFFYAKKKEKKASFVADNVTYIIKNKKSCQ